MKKGIFNLFRWGHQQTNLQKNEKQQVESNEQQETKENETQEWT